MNKIKRNDSSASWSSDSNGYDTPPPSSPPRTPLDSTTPIHPHAIGAGKSEGEHGQVSKDESSGSRAESVPSTMAVFPGYSHHSVQNRLEELSSRTHDFPTLTQVTHLRDRSPIIGVTQRHRCTLLRAPPGYGKSTIVSMLSYHYDLRHKEDHAYNFRRSEALQADWCPNSYYVLQLEFGGFDVKRQDFNLNDELNKALRIFVEGYGFLSEGEEWKELEDPEAAETLNNIISCTIPPEHELAVLIDDYDHPYWAASELAADFPERRDEVQKTLSDFYGSLANWNTGHGVALVFFTGTQQILSTVAKSIYGITYDIVREIPNTDNLVGFCEEDVQQIANDLQWSFHGLHLADLAEEFLSSEEAKMQLLHGAAWYKFSCRTVLEFFHEQLAERGKQVTEAVPSKMVRIKNPVYA
ncbi:hypothetical protein PQX77_010841 [Marasmius sp. AFHP31]|nr:hypothetical protein PQX77_010841 [Marasmius sp. AFHP31]